MLKRVAFALTLLALASQAWAQARGNIFSTKGQKEFEAALTAGGIFGAPRSTTALLPTCGTSNKGGVRYDSTTNTLKFCNGTTWASPAGAGGIAAGDNTAWTGTNSFIDSNFSIIGSTTASKVAKFEVDGFTAATTRTFTLPDADTTLVGLNLANVFTAVNSFGSIFISNGSRIDFGNPTYSNAANTFLSYRTEQTPDTLVLAPPSLSNHWIFAEAADATFDFAHAQQTNPTLFIHSANQSTTEWGSLAHNGTDFVVGTGAGSVSFPGVGTVSTRIGSGAAAAGGGGVAVGNAASASGTSTTAVGTGATAGFTGCTALGSGSTCTAIEQFVVGGGSQPITHVYIGRGVNSTTPSSTTYHGTGGLGGANQAGSSIILAGGQPTGTAAGGDVKFQTSPSSTTGATLIPLSDRAVIRAQAKALTAATATSFVRIGLPALSMAGGVLEYCIQASDGTDMQSMCGLLPFSVVNKAATETCTIGVTGTQNETLVAASSGTLSNTFTCDATPTNGVDLQANAVSSLTETTLQIVYQIRLNGAVGTTTITPQ